MEGPPYKEKIQLEKVYAFFKKLSGSIFLLIFTLLLVPQVTFAAWWNPLTWRVFDFFRKSEVKIEQSLDISTTTHNITATDNSSNTNTEKVKTPKVVEKKKAVIPTIIPTPQTTQINSAPVIVPTYTNPTKNEIDELRKVIENLTEKVNNLEKKNEAAEEQVNKLVKFKPEVILDKKVIDNNGSDRAQVKIRTINDDGTIVPNKEIEIITSIGSDGGPKETKTGVVTSDSNGDATYNTPTTTAYDRCGVFMSITVKIDNDFTFGQTVSIHNTKPVLYGGSGAGCP